MVSITSQPPSVGMMMPPPPPLDVKRPSMALKRDSSYLDTDDENDLSMITKKLKVDFDPNIDVKILDDKLDDKSLDLVREEVRWAIKNHLAPGPVKDDKRYNDLMQILRQEPGSETACSPKVLLKYLVALESRVNMLGECSKLVRTALEQDWLGRDEIFVSMYLKFIVSLASAHSKYLHTIMERLLQFFTNLPSWKGRLPGERVVTRSVMFYRLHLAIKTLLRRIPAANGVIVRVSKTQYPGESATSRKYAQYQRRLLEIGEYAPEIKSEIIAIIVQRLVALDVEVQLDIEEFEEEAEERLLQRRSAAAKADDQSDETEQSDSSSVESLTEDEEKLKDLRLKVAKIDCTMDLLFNYYDNIMTASDSQEDVDEAYQQLLSHFTTYIMPNRTRHAQFLLFHFSQTSLDHTTMFAQQCIEQGFSQIMSAQRHTAIAYLSSYIARGAHVSKDTTKSIVAVLCDYLEQMRVRYTPGCRGPDRRAYSLYYTIAQALLYIFCFKWRDLVIRAESQDEDGSDDNSGAEDMLAERGELRWLPAMRDILHRNIFGPLNPLKVCAPAIVGEFAKISRHVRFLEVLSKIESNKRLRFGSVFPRHESVSTVNVGRRETAVDRKMGDSHHQLEPYFPFDPYHLPVSKQWVENDYNEWKLPRGMKRDNDDFDEDSDQDSEIETHDDGIPLETASNSS